MRLMFIPFMPTLSDSQVKKVEYMLVDVSDFLPPDYKLPERETVKPRSVKKVKAKEGSTDNGKKLGAAAVREGLSSKQGKIAPKPSAEDQIFIVVRRGKVLPGSQKIAKKRGQQVASRVKTGRSSTSKISIVRPVASPVKTGMTSKISTVTSKISTNTNILLTKNSKTSTMIHMPPTTTLPAWKMKEAKRDSEARRWEAAKKKKKVEKDFLLNSLLKVVVGNGGCLPANPCALSGSLVLSKGKRERQRQM